MSSTSCRPRLRRRYLLVTALAVLLLTALLPVVARPAEAAPNVGLRAGAEQRSKGRDGSPSSPALSPERTVIRGRGLPQSDAGALPPERTMATRISAEKVTWWDMPDPASRTHRRAC